jgi:hypothetical protein
MAKIVLDRRGDVRKGVYYTLHVPSDDGTDSQKREDDWIVVPRTPTDDVLRARGEVPWMYLEGSGGEELETRDCPADPSHVTRRICRTFAAKAFGGMRVSSLLPQDHEDYFSLSPELWQRIRKLNLRGADVHPLNLIDGNQKKIDGFGALQFVGRAKRRLPRFVDVEDACPFCGKGKIFCESCRNFYPHCRHCNKLMWIIDHKHGGPDDKRIPYERGHVIDGQTWDGSDLVKISGINFASKRFIDWLLRVHAAPFYARPAWLYLDGMNDEQKKWFDELQKPLEA